jgi:hypothetical protein
MGEQRVRCEGCGNLLEPGDQFCGGCGRDVVSTGSKEISQLEARLRIIQGSQKGKEFQLRENGITLGRGQEADLFFGDPEASREHARVNWEKGRFTLMDLGSSNGTYLNGTKIVGSEELSHGDLITVGETVLEFQSVPQQETGRGVGSDRGDAEEKALKPSPEKVNSPRIFIFGAAALAVFVCVVSAILVGVLVVLPIIKPESPVVNDNPPTSPGVATIEIINQHSEDICGLALSPSVNDQWGGNWLTDGEILQSGSSMSFSIEPGIEYDFIAYTCFESVLVERFEIPIGEGSNILTVEPGN